MCASGPLVLLDAGPGPGRWLKPWLTALTYVGGYDRASGRRLRAFFGCLYYAAMRPGEALGLRRSDCTLPASG
jgi:integrase